MMNKFLIASITSIFIWIWAMLLYYVDCNVLCSIILIFNSFFLFYLFKNKKVKYFNYMSYFSFFYFFTIGLSTLRLHQFQRVWSIKTCIILETAYIAFLFGSIINIKKKQKDIIIYEIDKRKYRICFNIIFYSSFLALILESKIRGYIPILSTEMSSYKKFSVTGIHYFTISCCLIPTFAYLYWKKFKLNNIEKISILIKTIISFFISIVIVSRQLVLMTLFLLFFQILKKNKNKSNIYIIVLLILTLLLWTFLSIYRHQDNQYIANTLNIQSDSPISISNMQKYLYIAFNYDNFNYNVENNITLSYGYNSLFPIFALTGLKFVFNSRKFGKKFNKINAILYYISNNNDTIFRFWIFWSGILYDSNWFFLYIFRKK